MVGEIMRTYLTASAAALAFVVSAGVASAATFDFATDADVFFTENKYEGTFDQVYGDNADSQAANTVGNNEDGGITVNAFAVDHDSGAQLDPFMDSSNLGSDDVAGLGVCSGGTDFTGVNISDCSTGWGDAAGDDNLLFTEVLGLIFSEDVFITELFIRDKGHDPLTSSIAIMTDFENHVVQTFDVVGGWVQGLDQLAKSSVFAFTSAVFCEYETNSVSDDNGGPVCDPGDEIYLSTLTAQVPLPAAGFLLLGGLGGLAAMKRRKKA